MSRIGLFVPLWFDPSQDRSPKTALYRSTSVSQITGGCRRAGSLHGFCLEPIINRGRNAVFDTAKLFLDRTTCPLWSRTHAWSSAKSSIRKERIVWPSALGPKVKPIRLTRFNHGQGDRRQQPYRRPNNPKDGYRALAITTEGKIQLRSRNDTTSTDAIPVW